MFTRYFIASALLVAITTCCPAQRLVVSATANLTEIVSDAPPDDIAGTNFGLVENGLCCGGRFHFFSVQNGDSGTTLTLSNFQLTGDTAHFSLDVPSAVTSPILSGAHAFSIGFDPTASVQSTATLTFQTNDPIVPIFTMTVTGTGVDAIPAGPNLSVFVDSMRVKQDAKTGLFDVLAKLTVSNTVNSPAAGSLAVEQSQLEIYHVKRVLPGGEPAAAAVNPGPVLPADAVADQVLDLKPIKAANIAKSKEAKRKVKVHLQLANIDNVFVFAKIRSLVPTENPDFVANVVLNPNVTRVQVPPLH